ncbi:MAG: PilZ domain-containing protein [Spirochaetales bacterium]|nr:PilZ domain-containing protein [Spirochaetales bacterium]
MISTRPRDKRRHTRVDHSTAVEVTKGPERFSGRCVDISRTGMRVLVNLPATYRTVESIAFRLPNSSASIRLPCRLVRLHGRSETGEQVLGLEFDFHTEAQLLLIEAFVRETKLRQVAAEAAEGEQRQLPRAACAIHDVAILRDGIQTLSIDNISAEGLLVSFRGSLAPEESVQMCFRLPGDSRELRVSGQVVYVVENSFHGSSTAGIRFQPLSAVQRSRLTNFIVSSASGATMKALHERLANPEIDETYRIQERRRIAGYLKRLCTQESSAYILCEQRLQIFEIRIVSIDAGRNRFQAALPAEAVASDGAPGAVFYFSFFLDGGSYYFKTQMPAPGPRSGTPGDGAEHTPGAECTREFRLPNVLIQSEKRSQGRKTVPVAGEILLRVQQPGGVDRQITGRLIDTSQRGFLCEVEDAGRLRPRLRRGQRLSYTVQETVALASEGIVRHVRELSRPDGSRVLRVGVEAGIDRSGFAFRAYSSEQWGRMQVYAAPPLPTARIPNETLPVRYQDDRGREIAALLTATRLGVCGPVVVIPPAFGKKKEALSPLVATLTANFRQMGREVVVIRYDGTNRPGESSNEEGQRRRGYEMLRYRLSDGAGDLKATLRYVHHNPFFRPEEVILVTFSMSALDARKLLADPACPRVDHWVSCMGVPTAQSVLGNVLGGIDIIGNCQMGISNGIGGVLGHLIDLDVMARDLVEHKYAFLADARADMARIGIPVLWMFGSYDRWLSADEIKDLMSVEARAAREVIEVPCGHNLRASQDALRSFKLIAAAILERLDGQAVEPIDPDREEVLRLIASERERLQYRPELLAEEYWRNYLVGSGQESRGYDFYWDLPEFREFLATEVEMLAPASGERVADMGCGTGLLLEALLHHLAARRPPTTDLEVVAVDLVQEALERARARWDRTLRSYPQLKGLRLQCLREDLDPSRLLPLKQFVDDPTLGIEFLRDKVQGLRDSTVDLLARNQSPEMDDILRGAPISLDTLRYLHHTLHDGHFHEVLDLNRAARFLLGKLEPRDLAGGHGHEDGGSLSYDAHRALRTRDLRFQALRFADSALSFQLPFQEHAFDRIAASLFISYLFSPESLLLEFRRILRPGGTLLLSSMRPDSDVSLIFTDYVRSARDQAGQADRRPAQGSRRPEAGPRVPMPGGSPREADLSAARTMLNEAASLFELEEEGFFRFYTAEELAELLRSCGFASIRTSASLGTPPQAVIAVGNRL